MSTNEQEDQPTENISLEVNGEAVSAEVEPRLKLADFLRQHEGLHGVRVGCEHGVCGACTIFQDGELVKACLQYTVAADGTEIETVEGLAEDGELSRVQQAFHEEHALQCGFCTSGFVMATEALLSETPDPTHDEINEGLAGNICRCTGYQNIVDAVETAADHVENVQNDSTLESDSLDAESTGGDA